MTNSVNFVLQAKLKEVKGKEEALCGKLLKAQTAVMEHCRNNGIIIKLPQRDQVHSVSSVKFRIEPKMLNLNIEMSFGKSFTKTLAQFQV